MALVKRVYSDGNTVITAQNLNDIQDEIIANGNAISVLEPKVDDLEHEVCRRNLLDNWYFVGGGSQQGGGQFPINQRGQTSYTNQNAYSLDRWYIYSNNNTVTLQSDGLKISRSSGSWYSIAQKLENPTQYIGKKVTLSVLFEGSTTSPVRARIIDQNETTVIGTTSAQSGGLYYGTGTIPNGVTDLIVSFYATYAVTSDVIVKAMKLECGDTQTLAHNVGTDESPVWVLNELPNFEDEVIHCKTSTADSTDTYANHVISYDSPNPNLLDNWYFVGGGSQQGGGQFPINQRGQTSYSTVNTYTIDRWKMVANHTVNVLSTGIKITCDSSSSVNNAFVQYFPTLPSGTYTLSALIVDDTTTKGFHLRVNTSTSSAFTGTGLFTFTFTKSDAYNCALQFNDRSSDNGNYFTVAAVKLELGNTQTLAHQENGTWVLNEIPNFADELARCQRYYQRIESDSTHVCSIATGIGASNNSIRAPLYLPVPMRASPTVTTTGTINAQSSGGSPSVSFDGVYCFSGALLSVQFRKTGEVTPNNIYDIYLASNSALELSADL